MRAIQFMENEYYLLSGKGAGGLDLFRDEADYARFTFLLLYFQSPTLVQNVTFYTTSYLRKKRFPLGEAKLKKILRSRQLEPTAFVLMPGHYHLLVRNVERHSISAYMQRVLMAYGKYYNAKYGRSGHVFDGPYKCRHIKNMRELLAATRHIHRNPTESGNSLFAYEDYPYSTYQDYSANNRWGELLETKAVLSQFKDPHGYAQYLRSAGDPEASLMLDY